MGRLARYLQKEFEACCPPGWRCRCEVPVVSPQCGRLLGFVPRADVMLERQDGGRRLWVELEVLWNRAQVHLQRQLGMTAIAPGDQAGLAEKFTRWASAYGEFVQVDGHGAVILIPPAWWEGG